MLAPAQRSQGITLIELMVGLAIFAMLLAMGIPNFATFLQNSKIRNAANALQDGLALARAEAVRRNTNVQLIVGADSGWALGCTTTTTDCPDDIQTRPANEGTSNVTVTATPSAAFTVAFNGLGMATSLNAGANATFDISNSSGGKAGAAAGGAMRCLRVVVTSAGQIRMCDPKLTISKPSDPQAC